MNNEPCHSQFHDHEPTQAELDQEAKIQEASLRNTIDRAHYYGIPLPGNLSGIASLSANASANANENASIEYINTIDTLRADRDACIVRAQAAKQCQDATLALCKDYKELMDEMEAVLRHIVAAAQANQLTIKCAYCGTLFTAGTQEKLDELIRDHVQACEKNPLVQQLKSAYTSNAQWNCLHEIVERRAEENLRNANHWQEVARMHAKNEEYYRGLVVQIGDAMGHDAYVADDGTVSDDVLCAKVPELVVSMMTRKDKLKMATEKKDFEVRQVASKPESFSSYAAKAENIVASWPSWKQSTRATSYPRGGSEASTKSNVINCMQAKLSQAITVLSALEADSQHADHHCGDLNCPVAQARNFLTAIEAAKKGGA